LKNEEITNQISAWKSKIWTKCKGKKIINGPKDLTAAKKMDLLTNNMKYINNKTDTSDEVREDVSNKDLTLDADILM